MSAGLFLVYQSPHSRLEVHLRNQVYVLRTKKFRNLFVVVELRDTHGVGLGKHSEDVFSFADSILNPFRIQKV